MCGTVSVSFGYCSTSDVLAHRRNIHHRPALLWRFRNSGAGYKTTDLLTYFLCVPVHFLLIVLTLVVSTDPVNCLYDRTVRK